MILHFQCPCCKDDIEFIYSIQKSEIGRQFVVVECVRSSWVSKPHMSELAAKVLNNENRRYEQHSKEGRAKAEMVMGRVRQG